MQHAEEAAAEAKAQRHGGLGLKGQRGVVELQFFQRVAKIRVFAAVLGVNAAVDHRPHLAVAGQRLRRGVFHARHRVADLRFVHVLDARGEVADLAGLELLGRLQAQRTHQAALEHLERRARGHHLDLHAGLQGALLQAHVDDDTAVSVVIAVENERLQRGVRVALRAGEMLHDVLEHGLDVDALLGGNFRRVLGGDRQNVLDLLLDALGVGGGQVDLVEHGANFKVVLHRKIRVCERLRLDALRGVDDEQRALTRRERARDLVVEVDVARRVDEVEGVDLAVGRGLVEGDGARLDGDAALALQIHVVEDLIRHLARGDGIALFKQPVRQRRLAVVDMRDDTEISDVLFVHSLSSLFPAKQGIGFFFRAV